jgi:hypothetical protein
MTREAVRDGRYIESSELSHSFQFPTGPRHSKWSKTLSDFRTCRAAAGLSSEKRSQRIACTLR